MLYFPVPNSVRPILIFFLASSNSKVVDELGESLERERQREHAARAVLEGAVSRGGVVLPEVLLTKRIR